MDVFLILVNDYALSLLQYRISIHTDNTCSHPNSLQEIKAFSPPIESNMATGFKVKSLKLQETVGKRDYQTENTYWLTLSSHCTHTSHKNQSPIKSLRKNRVIFTRQGQDDGSA